MPTACAQVAAVTLPRADGPCDSEIAMRYDVAVLSATHTDSKLAGRLQRTQPRVLDFGPGGFPLAEAAEEHGLCGA